MFSEVVDRVRGFFSPSGGKKDCEQSFRDLVILAAREVRSTGQRQVVAIHPRGYTKQLLEARAWVASRDHRYPLKDHLILQQTADLVLQSAPEFQGFQVFGQPIARPDLDEPLVELFIREKIK